eukprot:GHVU01029191.1.p1 GENE.GHVU01029191.1~~GHVU01029191.1.p1  ORF type:complete len:278 (+),score=36.96 GHVU01029191.1:448-1281(+)
MVLTGGELRDAQMAVDTDAYILALKLGEEGKCYPLLDVRFADDGKNLLEYFKLTNALSEQTDPAQFVAIYLGSTPSPLALLLETAKTADDFIRLLRKVALWFDQDRNVGAALRTMQSGKLLSEEDISSAETTYFARSECAQAMILNAKPEWRIIENGLIGRMVKDEANFSYALISIHLCTSSVALRSEGKESTLPIADIRGILTRAKSVTELGGDAPAVLGNESETDSCYLFLLLEGSASPISLLVQSLAHRNQLSDAIIDMQTVCHAKLAETDADD